MGEDPIEVCRYFASRDRINHVHFRNVLVMKPYERYREVWIDEGMNNMFAVMKELVKNKYTHLIYPEHPRRLDYDAEHGPIGGYPGGGAYAAIALQRRVRARDAAGGDVVRIITAGSPQRVREDPRPPQLHAEPVPRRAARIKMRLGKF